MEKITLADKYLTFSDESKKLMDAKIAELLVDTFNKIYADICDFFNNGEIRPVVYTVDFNVDYPAALQLVVWEDDDGVQHLENDKIVINPKICFDGECSPWDIDGITHELVHVAQDYGLKYHPLWVSEGIAQYGRAKFGLYNEKAGWSLLKYDESHRYSEGYREAASFFVWLEANIFPELVKDINYTIKAGKYTDDYFTLKTGKTVDELWQMYADANK